MREGGEEVLRHLTKKKKKDFGLRSVQSQTKFRLDKEMLYLRVKDQPYHRTHSKK